MPKRKKPTAPRVTIYDSGRATLSGVEYHDLRSIITQASLHNYDALECAQKKGVTADEAYAREQLQLVERVEAAIMQAVAASFRPAPSTRTGWRFGAEPPLREVPKAERRRRVQQEKNEHECLARFMAELEAA